MADFLDGSNKQRTVSHPRLPRSAAAEHLREVADADVSFDPSQWEGPLGNTPSHNHQCITQSNEIEQDLDKPPEAGATKAAAYQCAFQPLGGEDWLGVSFYVDFTRSDESSDSTGFDSLARTLDQAQAAAVDLERAKDNYIQVGAADEVMLGKHAFIVAPSGARLGGKGGLRMRWRLHSQHGLTVLIANMPEVHSSCPNVSIQASSEPLMRWGFSKVWGLMQDYIASMGGDIERNRLSRVDACVDLPEIEVGKFCEICNSEWFITRAKHGPNPYRQNGHATGFTVGKTPLLLRVYDKLRECGRESVKFCLLVDRGWAVVPESVTRVELQLSRTTLKKYGVDTVEDWINMRATILDKVIRSWFRLTDGPIDRRHTDRTAMHPLWENVCNAFTHCFGESDNLPLVPLPKQSVNMSKQVKQVVGILVGIFARIGKPIIDNEKFFREADFAMRDVVADRDLCAEVRRKMMKLGVPVPPVMDEACVVEKDTSENRVREQNLGLPF
ncbi:replication initiation factor domain-containing protein [Bythopirellula goksoeyrii]|uniref:Uncharacterized protein n=1 Tax=Bythopirellula goksoeyrii TaxID=1400387 RepID=A0A5B9QB88_9BACT|nr:replication initiation factor domain-containing protein [Bythopirellula goksoeyrii]QEG36188.1 hypothetical protein Pr1d_34970 [Bythopirellula goksoeyrii]